MAREDGLDDLSLCRGDSTAVEANSQYPTDSGLMKAFAQKQEYALDQITAQLENFDVLLHSGSFPRLL